MGVYVVTGGSGGIGGATIDLLKEQGHEVADISLQNADIYADLALGLYDLLKQKKGSCVMVSSNTISDSHQLR